MFIMDMCNFFKILRQNKNSNNKGSFPKKYILTLLVAILFIGGGSALWAQNTADFEWNGGTGSYSDYETKENWNGNKKPTDKSTVSIPKLTSSNNYPVIFANTVENVTITDISAGASLTLRPKFINPNDPTSSNRSLNITFTDVTNSGSLNINQHKYWEEDSQTPGKHVETNLMSYSNLTVTNLTNNNTGVITIDEGCTLTITGTDSTSFTNNGRIINYGTIKTDATINGSIVEGNQPIPINISNVLEISDSTSYNTTTKIPANIEKIIFIGNLDQTIDNNNNYVYPIVEIKKTGGSVTFSGDTQIKQLIDSTNGLVDITFNSGCNIQNSTTFNTTGAVTFGNNSNCGSITHLNGKTTIKGTMNAYSLNLEVTELSSTVTTKGSQNYNNKVTLLSDATLKGESIFLNDIEGPFDLTLHGNSSLNGTTKIKSIVNNNTLSISQNNTVTLTAITNNASSYINNKSKIESSTITNNGIIINDAVIISTTITNGGTITNNSTGVITNSRDLINNSIIDNNNNTEKSIHTKTISVIGTINTNPVYADSLILQDNFDSSKTNVIYTTLELTGSNAQEFIPINNHQFPNITIDKTGGSVTFKTNLLNVGTLKIDNCPKIVFESEVDIKTLTLNNTTGNISFNGGGNIVGGFTSNSSDTLTIDATKKSFTTTGKLENTKGKSELKTTISTDTSLNTKIKADSIVLGTSSVEGNISSTNGQSYSELTLTNNAYFYSDKELVFTTIVNNNTFDISISSPNSKITNPISVGSITTTGLINLPSSITTSKDQTYNGTIQFPSSTTFNAGDIGNIAFETITPTVPNCNLTVSNANKVIFNNAITDTPIPIQNINITSKESIAINGGKILGDATFITPSLTFSKSKFEADNITHNSNTTAIESELNASSSIDFGNTNLKANISATTINLGDTTVYGSSTITAAISLAYTNLSITNKGILTIPNKLQNTTSSSIDNNGKLILLESFTNKGSFTDKGTILLKGDADQTFTPNTTDMYNNIVIEKNKGSVTFGDNLNLSTLVDNTKSSIPISFGTGSISNNTLFNTVGKLLFSKDFSFSNSSLTHTKGPTEIRGKLIASSLELGDIVTFSGTDPSIETTGNQTYSGTIKLLSPISFNAGNLGSITFNTIEGNNDLSITSANIIKFNTQLSNTSIKYLTISSSKSVSFSGGIISGAGSLTSSSVSTSSNLTIAGNLTNNSTFSSTNNAKLILKSNLTDTGYIKCPIELNSDKAQIITTNDKSSYNISITGTKNTDNTVTFNNKITLTAFSSTRKVIFSKGAIINGDFTIVGSLDVSSGEPFYISNLIIDTNGNLTYSGILSVDNFTNNGTLALSGNTDIKVNDDFTDNGTISKKSYTISIYLMRNPQTPIGKPNQTFTASSTIYDLIEIDDTSLQQKVPIIFNNNLQTTKFTDFASFDGDITFNTSGVITTATFNTTGTVSFITDTSNNYTITNGLTHTKGNTIINGYVKSDSVNLGDSNANVVLTGNVETTKSQLYNGIVDIQGAVDLLANNQEIIFNKTIDGKTDSSLSIGKTDNKPSKVSFIGNIGSDTSTHGTNNLSSINISALEIHLPAEVKTSNDQKYNGKVILSDNTTLDSSSNGNISFNSYLNSSDNNPKNLTITNANTVTFKNNITAKSINNLIITAAVINLPSKVTTQQNQIIASDLKLSIGGSELNSTGGDIELKSPIQDLSNNPFSIVVSDSQNIKLWSSITTNGKQTFNGNALLENDSQIYTTKEVTFNKTINGSHSLIIGKTETKPSKVTLKGNVGTDNNTLTSLNINANEINLPTTISTSGEQTYIPGAIGIVSSGTTFNGKVNIQGKLSTTGNLEFNSDVTLNGDTTFDTTTDFIDTNVKGTINGNHSLITNGMNNVTFEGAIGTEAPLVSLDVSSTKKNVTLPSSITTSGYIKIVNSTNLSTPSITLKDLSTTSLTGNNIYLSDNINCPNSSLELTNSGILYFYDSTSTVDVASIAQLASLNQISSTDKSTIELQGDINTTVDIQFTSPITLTGNVLLSSTSNISLANTINGNFSLTIGNLNNQPREVTLGGDIGTKDSLVKLDINALQKIEIPSSVTTNDTQTFIGPVFLAKNTVLLSPSVISFKSTINSKDTTNKSLKIAKSFSPNLEKALSVSFEGNIGNINKLSNITVSASSITFPESINTIDTQSYEGELKLVKTNTTLNANDSTVKKNIDINGSIIATINAKLTLNSNLNSDGLKLNIPNGNIIIEGTTSISTLSDNANNNYNISFNNGGSISTVTELQTTGTVTFNKSESQKIETTFSIGSSPDYANFTHSTGKTVIYDSFYTNELSLSNLEIGGFITTTGQQYYNGPVLLLSDTTLLIPTSGDGTITFNDTVKGKEKNLIIKNLTNKIVNNIVSFNKEKDIGEEVEPLNSLSIQSTSINLPQNVYVITQIYNGSLSSTAQNVLLRGHNIELKDSITNEKLNLQIDIITKGSEKGTLTFNDSKGDADTTSSAKLTSFTQTGSATVKLSGDINTTGDISFESPITLTGDVLLSSKSNITLNDTVDGEKSLTIGDTANTPQNINLHKDIGSNSNLTNLNIKSLNNTLLPSSISTSNNQTYDVGNEIKLAKDTTLIGNDITITDNITGDTQSLSINNKGHLYFNDKTSDNDTDSVSTLKSFNQEGTFQSSKITISGDIKTTSGISFKNSPISLHGHVKLLGSDISFNDTATINGAYNLILGDTKTNTISFNNNIDTIASLTTNANESINITSSFIKTTGNQLFNGPVIVTKDTHINSSTDGSLIFNKDVDSINNQLTVSTKLNSNEIKFYGNLKVKKLIDTSNNGSITFIGPVEIYSSTVLATPNNITFTSTTSLSDQYDITHITGKSIIADKLTAKAVSLSETNFINKGCIDSKNTVSIGINTQPILFNSSISSNTIKSLNNQTYHGPITLQKPSSFSITTDLGSTSPIITIKDSITLNDNKLSLIGHTSYTGDNITTSTNALIDASNYDFVINPTANTIINAPISAKRIIIDNSSQNITISKNITASNDIAIFGEKYCTTDQESKVSKIYNYDFTSAALVNNPISRENISSSSVTLLLDNINLSSNTILYINGVNFGTSNATFNIPNNFNTIERKSEAFYSDFSNSNITISTPRDKKLVTEACILSSSQTFDKGWDSDTLSPFEIEDAYTIDDDVIYIKFNRQIRLISDNENGLTQTNGNRINYSKDPYDSKIYIDGKSNDFEKLPITEKTSKNVSLKNIYLTASDTWNTDATGSNAGLGTDKEGKHKEVIPYLDIKRNDSTYNYFITDLYGKRLTQYSTNNNNVYKNAHDKCDPVLVSVTTGQELHTTDSTLLKSYDAHNFLELRYSERVRFGETDNAFTDFDNKDFTFNETQNITSTDATFGLVEDKENDFSISRLGKVEKGRISTGPGDVNTLYRKDPFSIRISIAGLTTGSGKDMKWNGYINAETRQPSGKFTVDINNSPIYDMDKNPLTASDLKSNGETLNFLNKTQPSSREISIPTSIPTGCSNANFFTYGEWDLSAPTFAPVNIISDEVKWNSENPYEYEILGYASGGTKIENLEFHMFDNTHNYDNTSYPNYVWYSTKGWIEGTEKITACADIFGGARPYLVKNGLPIDGQATTGGIRFHTLNPDAFSYKTDNSKSGNFKNVFDHNNVHSSFFTGFSIGETLEQSAPGELYFSLELDNKEYPIVTNFTISYNPSETTGYVTDLAGNKLLPTKENQIHTIDRTPPAFNILLSPINQDEIFIVFSKELQTNLDELIFRVDTKHEIPQMYNSTYEEAIPYSFKIIKIDDNGNVINNAEGIPAIDTNTPASIQTIKKADGATLTSIRLKLTRPLTYEDLITCHIQLTPTLDTSGQPISTSFDPITGTKDARVTIIRDKIGNFMPMYTANLISDFGINIITPLYAHNSTILNGEDSFMDGLYEDGSWAVHDWSRNQQNYGTLYANKDVQIVASLDDGTKEQNNLPKGAAIFLDSSPDSESVSTRINKDLASLKVDYRIWLPSLKPTDYLFNSIAPVNNTEYHTLYSDKESEKGKQNDSTLLFNINEDVAKSLGNNKQISFLFAISENEITPETPFSPLLLYNSPTIEGPDKYDLSQSTKKPLYCLRLEDPNDITSIDLWSYKTKTINRQRGGVTILNNVINATNGEDAVINITAPSSGNLSVMILTLDGNVVQYLHRGNIEAGEYNFYWNGTNLNNTKVARGLYFVRVIGLDIDETRKIMVVR